MRIVRLISIVIAASVLLAGYSMGSPTAAPPVPPQVNALAQTIQNALLTPGAGLGIYDVDLETLRRFYAGRKYLPAWSSDPVSNRNAGFAIAELERSGEDGLDEGDYHLVAIHEKSHSSAEFDLLLTAGVLSYMHDLRVGRVLPAVVGRDIELPTVKFDTAAALSDALAGGTIRTLTAYLAPPHMEYTSLKRALARYREIDRNGGWPQIGAAPAGKLSADDPRLEILRRRLAAEDAVLGNQPGSASVEELTGALMRFQARNGLEADGKLGKQTLAALNTTAAQRISQIVANMERWRWLPRPFEQRYIEVNAADATLKAVDGGNVTLTSRIVAGKPATPTPIFAATVTGVTVNPSWNIPPIIARHELLPKERRHPGYLASQHILFDGPDGMLRQQPGAGNSLGRVKLEMPNRFNSYLHDTPARTLFARTDRHFSHGCMRVEQIEPLASWALTGDASAALDRIAAAITAGDTSRISLDRPLPVYVLYWTAIANPDGTVETRPDVYGRDTKLLAALAGQHVVGRSAMNTNCPVSSAG